LRAIYVDRILPEVIVNITLEWLLPIENTYLSSLNALFFSTKHLETPALCAPYYSVI